MCISFTRVLVKAVGILGQLPWALCTDYGVGGRGCTSRFHAE